MTSSEENKVKSTKQNSMPKPTTEIKTISISPTIIQKLDEAIEIAKDFELLTRKQLNITGIVGEILVSQKLNLKLVVDDINEAFDALDKDNKKVQIKTRRYKGVDSAMTGPLLDKNFNVPFDYAILILLNQDYSFKELFRIEASAIQLHFDRINSNRKSGGKLARKTMSISQFKNLALKQTNHQ